MVRCKEVIQRDGICVRFLCQGFCLYFFGFYVIYLLFWWYLVISVYGRIFFGFFGDFRLWFIVVIVVVIMGSVFTVIFGCNLDNFGVEEMLVGWCVQFFFFVRSFRELRKGISIYFYRRLVKVSVDLCIFYKRVVFFFKILVGKLSYFSIFGFFGQIVICNICFS